MAVGWWLHRRGLLSEPRAARLVRWIVMWPSPIVLCFLFWTMDLHRLEPWLLPFLGMLISFSTLLPARLYARFAGLSKPQIGSFLTCAFFSNLGYFGAFIAFALYGEAAYGLCMLYLLFFTPCFYTWGFWVAARHGEGAGPSGLQNAFNDELRLYPFLGMVAGLLLNLAGLPRPLLLEQFNHVLIPLNTGLYLIAIGSQLIIESPRPWLRASLAMGAIKFLYTPLVAWGLATLFGLQGLPRLMVLLQASTPVAVSPLVLPLLFGLDRKLANALWLFTTALAIPWIVLVLPLLSRL
jgi:predicted permease